MVSILVIHLPISWEFQHRFQIKLRLLAITWQQKYEKFQLEREHSL